MPNSALRSKLKLRHIEAQSSLRQKHPHAQKFFEESGIDLGKIRQHSTKLLTAGAISGALLAQVSHYDTSNLNHPNNYEFPKTAMTSSPADDVVVKPVEPATVELENLKTNEKLALPKPIASVLTDSGKVSVESPRQFMLQELQKVLPSLSNRFSPPFLSREDEKIAETIVSRATKIPARTSLEGEHLNTTYGYIGAEQHLARYPGDKISNHDIQEAGIAPGLGGFGYFNDTGALTQDAIIREKYYVVAPLMYLPDWGKRTKYLANWYKWRKIVVINLDNGNAVVGDMGDAGPAAWTGKQFGGSPEVMDALGGPKYKKGKVLFLFVDDPQNKIPLGPVKYDNIQKSVLQSI